MNKKKMIVIGMIIVIFLCLVIGLLLPNSKGETPVYSLESTSTIVIKTVEPTSVAIPTEDLNVDNPTLATIMCEEFVLDQLTSPFSAEFSGFLDEWPKVMPYGGDTTGRDWHVVDYVDSQNEFGAMIRNFYTCQISYVGNDQWKLLDLWFHE